MLHVADLLLVDVDGSTLILETTQGRLLTNDRLYKFRNRLANPDFVQVSKHALININHLKALENSFSGNMLAILTGKIKADVSRRYLSELENLGLWGDIDEMFNDWGIDGNTKVITDEKGGLFYSLTDNYAILKTYATDSGE